MIQIHPVLPFFQVLLLVAAIIAATYWLYKREGRGSKILFGVRVAVVAILGLVLLNPVQILSAKQEDGKSPILVLVDKSHSMSIQDVDGKPRIDAVRQALFAPNVTAALTNGHRAAYFGFDAKSTLENPQSLAKPGPVTGNQTYIGEAISGALASAGDARTGAVLVVSDGRDNGEISPAEFARQSKARGFPVFTVCVGKETKTKDLAVQMNRPQVFTTPKQEVSLAADVMSSGFEDVSATLHLLREGVKVSEKSVVLKSGSHTEVSFPVKEPAKGTYRFSIEVAAMPGEITVANNRASSLVSVGNATTQVLVLEGKPTWETKFLIQALRSDPSLGVDSIFQLTKDRSFAIQGVAHQDTEGGNQVKVPKLRADFAKYDVVIIGKGFEEFFTEEAAKQLQEYVSQDGGHLIFLRGDPSNGSPTLAALEPLAWDETEISDFRMKVTHEGATNPAFGFGAQKGAGANEIIERLPSMISATRVAKEKALSVVLARANGANNRAQPNLEMAVLAYQRYGDGLVLSLVGQGLWRWALLPPDLVDYSSCYTDFWTQMVRWMVNQSDFLPGQNLSLKTDHYVFSPGDTVNLLAFVRGSNHAPLSNVIITEPSGKTTQVSLSKANGKQADYLGAFRPKVPGDYTATISQPGSRGGLVTAPFSVYEHRQEDMNTSADPGLMAQIAEAGGGKALSLNEIDQLPRLLRESRSWQQKKPEPQSIWDRWEVLALILGLLSLEWIFRRRGGFV